MIEIDSGPSQALQTVVEFNGYTWHILTGDLVVPMGEASPISHVMVSVAGPFSDCAPIAAEGILSDTRVARYLPAIPRWHIPQLTDAIGQLLGRDVEHIGEMR